MLNLFVSGIAMSTGSLALTAPAFSNRPEFRQAQHSFKFDLVLNNDKIGTHMLNIERVGISNLWRHETTVNASVSLGIFGDITFYHHSIEEWEDGRLRILKSETDDDGEKFSVNGHADGTEFAMDGPDGRYRASGQLLTTNGIWTEQFCRETEVIDAATGGVIGVVIDSADNIMARDAAKRGLQSYEIVSAKITGQLLYNTSGIWAGGVLQKNGQEVEYDQKS